VARKTPAKSGSAAREDGGDLAFEGALDELEGLVERLESGELPLEEALRDFERGVGLSRRCAELLERAERRIDELVREGGLRAFEPEAEADGGEG